MQRKLYHRILNLAMRYRGHSVWISWICDA